MSILKVAHLGHPVLRQRAEAVDPALLDSDELQIFIDDLLDTMHEYDGAGLAAPQVHESIRVVAYEVAGNPRYPDAPAVPLTVLINPEISPLSDDMDEDWEGCLSLPDLRGRVPRHTEIKVDALDRDGKRLSFVAKEFHARVVQHECDHLDGKLFIDRMTDFESLSFLTEFLRYAGTDGDGDDDVE